uniref:Protein tweety homolog n=1 Tax=Electrophorus electricus TaxID=8005 RepID=A0A4W4FNR1_ELEEL
MRDVCHSVTALSDFCFDPNTFVVNSTHFTTGTSTGVVIYHLFLSFSLLTQSQRALSSIHSHLFNLERDTLPRFPKAEKPLREVQQMLNITEGNFHQLVALLNCRAFVSPSFSSSLDCFISLSTHSFLLWRSQPSFAPCLEPGGALLGSVSVWFLPFITL